MSYRGVLLSAFFVCACEPETPPLPTCSAAIPSGVATEGSVAAACSEAGAPTPSLSTVADLTVDGWQTIGPAIEVGGSGPWPHGLDVVLRFESGKLPKNADRQIAILVQKRKAPAHAGLVTNIVVEPRFGKVHFHTPDGAIYQPAIPAAGRQKVTRRYTWRALSGVSMGGFGASVNMFKHPERWDAIAVMGADVPIDFSYTLGIVADFSGGGFCNAVDDGEAKIGQSCPVRRKPLVDQHELAWDYDHWLYQGGDGVGLTLRRALYLKGNRDLTRALGNAGYYNPESKFRPPGVPQSHLDKPNADYCRTPVVLKKFFDRRYNPKGTFDVITYCDGNDGETLGYGVFDPGIEATNPTQITLAVDVNGNGKRDLGEPIVQQGGEPYDDLGPDGKASKDEPGYDPVSNPDPSGDDYHYLWNPAGTEGNWRWDPGERFLDYGLDGVPMSAGGCPAGSGPDCWDWGEGNGKFDYSPMGDNWRAHDPRLNLEAMSADALARIDVYYDAGIRDFFNTHVATNSMMASLLAKGQPVRAFDGFPAIVGFAPSREQNFDVRNADYPSFGRHMYVRYGDPDASKDAIESGDGRHVGLAVQAVHRVQSMLTWLSAIWPNGDRELAAVEPGRSRVDGTIVVNGRASPYSVVLPPGYHAPENANKRYPVVFLGHGYGMQPVDLAQVSIVAQNSMVDDRVPEAKRMQKFIVVLADAACRPEWNVAENGPIPQGESDQCETGAFYVNHPEGRYRGEQIIEALESEISSKYRVRQAEQLVVEQ